MARKKLTEGLRQKPNGVWEMSQVIDGKRKWFSDTDPVNVWAKRDAYIRELGTHPAVEKKNDLGPLFSAVADAYDTIVVNEMPNGTAKVYRPAIKRAVKCFGNMQMRAIEPYMVSQFLADLPFRGKTTVTNQRSVISAIFKLWINDPQWHGNCNPVQDAKTPRGLVRKTRNPPTDEQIKIVKENADDPQALLPLLFLCTGARRGEILALQAKDIDLPASTISITKSVEHNGNSPTVGSTKTGAGVRTVPLLARLRAVVEPLLETLAPDDYVVGGGEKPITASQYDSMWRVFWKKHGQTEIKEATYLEKTRNGMRETLHREHVPTVTAHQFRHEYVCMLCQANVPMEVAIQLVGHADKKMIEDVYNHLKPKMVDQAKLLLDLSLNGE